MLEIHVNIKMDMYENGLSDRLQAPTSELITVPAIIEDNDNLPMVACGTDQTVLSGQSIIGGCKLGIVSSVTFIGGGAFEDCDSLSTVYYHGTSADWDRIQIDYLNNYLTSATRYYYSESNPFEGENAVTSGNYWHYDTDGKTPIVWKMDR